MSKKFWITTGVVASVIGVTAIVAHAERGSHDGFGYGRYHDGFDGGYHHRRGWRDRWRREITKEEFDAKTRSRFAKWDANSDGVVDREEAAERVSRRMERRWGRRSGRRMGRMMRRFDTNDDGRVTTAEVETYVTERFARMDLTGDGRITDEDLPPLMRGRGVLDGEGRMRRRGWRRHHHGGKRGRRRMKHALHFLIRANRNKDGVVTLEEAQAQAARRFDRFDRNDDGAIDKDDRDALRKEMLDYRVQRFMHRFGAAADGRLTLEQFTKFRDARFAKRDRDGNGVLEGRELRRGHRWGRGHGWGRWHGERNERGDERRRGRDENNRGGGDRQGPGTRL